MDDSLYDEFGNYVGPELSGDESDGSEGDSGAGGSSDEDGSGMDLDAAEAAADARLAAGDADQQPGQHLVLHEDKKYYPSAEEVYGEGVETLVEDEDAQPLETPIIAPPKDPKLGAAARDALPTKYPVDFMVNLMNTPELVRNVAVVGHLHAGKTVLMDNLVTQTHDTRGHPAPARDAQMRYTDTRVDEQLREISIKSAPMSLVLESAKVRAARCSIPCRCCGARFATKEQVKGRALQSSGRRDGAGFVYFLVFFMRSLLRRRPAWHVSVHTHWLVRRQLSLHYAQGAIWCHAQLTFSSFRVTRAAQATHAARPNPARTRPSSADAQQMRPCRTGRRCPHQPTQSTNPRKRRPPQTKRPKK